MCTHLVDIESIERKQDLPIVNEFLSIITWSRYANRVELVQFGIGREYVGG